MGIEVGLRAQLELLKSYGSKITWGERGKGLISLARELRKGESSLRYVTLQETQELGLQEGLLREFSISCVYVFYNLPDGRRLQLIEAEQFFKTGQKIDREFSWLTEKSLNLSETPLDTAHRALKEELGINPNKKRLRRLRQIMQTDSANTYPGLNSRVTATDYEIVLTNEEYEDNIITLPDGQRVHGFKETQKDKVTYFIWKEID